MKDLDKCKKEIIALIKSRLNDMIPNTPIAKVYEETINAMSDERFKEWIIALRNGVQDFPDTSKPAELITIVSPNLDPANQLSIKRNLALSDKMGFSFFEHVWLTNPITNQTFKSNKRYLVMDIPVRRQAQTLMKKISLPDGTGAVDERTGQVTGKSKGSGLSYPEIQMLDAQGLDKVIYEMIKIRGGDEDAQRLMMKRLVETGEINQEQVEALDTTTKVNKTLSRFLHGMHIRNNVVE